jgi:predicted metal-dependent HD superfamily phosphohydrolase
MADGLMHRWQQLIQGFGLPGAAPIGAELIERYREPHRRFHGPTHLVRVLDQLDEAHADRRLHLAAWFHDAIYRPNRRDNEQRSAALAGQRLAAIGLPALDIAFVMQAVLATAGHDSADSAFDPLLDADLAVLGANPDEYLDYSRAIRQEFARVPTLLFSSARTRFLRSMLDRPAIYRTSVSRQRYEHSARQNLQAELNRLSGAH